MTRQATVREVTFRCGTQRISLRVPGATLVYDSRFPSPVTDEAAAVLEAAGRPVAGKPLAEALRARRPGKVVIAVSDITRPVPYPRFLARLLAHVEQAGVPSGDITLLVATGMHRSSTPEEHRTILGAEVCDRYEVVDHSATDEGAHVEVPGKSWSGARMRVDARFAGAGFRMVTGLVEPHFMAGFSGGRKAVCPGLADLETVRNFHGYSFLANPAAHNANLEGNPLHEEALSVARAAGVDFALDVVLDSERRIVAAFGGSLEPTHAAACRLARQCACPSVSKPADIVATSCGGSPLDATFYQCVKGFVSCLPAVKPGGTVIAFGGCAEGIGSTEYAGTMAHYAGRWQEFLRDIESGALFVKDQWQLQMHCRTLERVGGKGLHFVTDGLSAGQLGKLSVTGHAVRPGQVGPAVQELLDELVRPGMTVAVIPEGPYCAPVVG